MKKNIIIIGGGLAGIVSSFLVKRKNNNVMLIEQNKKLGGLFLSRKLFKNLYFDYGSHFLRQTGIRLLDKIIFSTFKKNSFHILGNLKGGSYFNNYLNNNSPFLDTSKLPKNIYQKGINEILKKKKYINNAKNLAEEIQNKYGKIFLKSVFKPIIKTKTFGCDLKSLPINLHNFFGLGRIKAFSPEISQKIKKNKYYDNIFSYHHYAEGESKLKSFYPKNGGAGKIIHLLEKRLLSKKVKILKNTKITKIKYDSGYIKSVSLGEKKILKCDKLIWTLNPNILFKIIQFRYEEKKFFKKKYFTSLHHFAFNKQFLTNNEYIQCHDPKMKTYRLTLYPNIHRYKNIERQRKLDKKKYFHLTAETVLPIKVKLPVLEKIVLKEIYRMGIISKKTKTVFKFSEIISLGSFIPTIDNLIENKKKFSFLKKNIKNIYFSSFPTGFSYTRLILENIYNKFHKGI